MKRFFTAYLFLLALATVPLVSFSQNAPNNFAGTSTSTTITLTWDAETGGSNTGYIIKARRNPGGSFPATPAYASLPISNDDDMTDHQGIHEILSENTVTFNGFTNLTPGARYDFEIYTYDNNSFSSAASVTVYTLATPPTAEPGGFSFSATGATAQIDLLFTAASAWSANGYALFRKQGGMPTTTVTNGTAPGGTDYLGDITSGATSYIDGTAVGGLSYTYALVPYTVTSGPVTQTYNYGTQASITPSATRTLTATFAATTGEVTTAVGGDLNRKILSFTVVSTGSQTLQSLIFDFDIDITGILNTTTFALKNGGSTLGTATYSAGTKKLTVSGMTQAVTSTPITLDLYGDVVATTNAATFTVSLKNADNPSDNSGSTFNAGVFAAFADLPNTVAVSKLEATFASAAGAVTTAVAGDANKKIFSMTATSNGTQTLQKLIFDFDIDVSTSMLIPANFVLKNGGSTVGTASYNGGTKQLTVTGIATSISSTVTLDLFADFQGGATGSFTVSLKNATNPSDNSVSTVNQGFIKTFTDFGNTVTVVPLTTSIASLTTGVAPSPLEAGSLGTTTTNAIFGFSITTNGTQNVSKIKVKVSSNPVGKFTSYALVESPDGSFSTTAGHVTAVPNANIAITGTGTVIDPYYIEITPAVAIAITGTTKNYFLVATVSTTANSFAASPTASIQPSLASTDVTVSPVIVITANSFNGTDYSFRPSQNSTIAFSASGTTSNIDYTAFQASTGLTTGTSASLGTFNIRDGGATDDADAMITTMTSVNIQFGNYTDLRTVAIFDGTTLIKERPVVNDTVLFVNLSLATGADGGGVETKNFNIRATFNTDVTDNNTHTVSIYSATASAEGSGFIASPGGATTGSANNIIVTATKLIFVDPSDPTESLFRGPVVATAPNTCGCPEANFNVKLIAVDANNNRDLNNTATINALTFTGGPGGAVLTGGGSVSLVAGARTYTNLSFNRAGTFLLAASDGVGGLTDASVSNLTDLTVSIQSLGVNITDGIGSAPPTLAVCHNGNFQTLGNIRIEESDPSDFSVGTNVTFSMQLPYGYIFNTGITTAPTSSGSEISSISNLSYSFGNTVVQFSYTITGISNINSITIAGLQVKYTLGTDPTDVEITRRGGTALQAGNAVSDEVSHGTVTSTEASNVGYNFIVQQVPGEPFQQPNETNFSSSVNGVFLVPSNGANVTTNDVFSGNGVSYSAVQNAYIFSPSAVGSGNYLITYSATNASGCQIDTARVFTVFATSIDGLASSYCANDQSVPTLSVDPDKYDISQWYSAWSSTTLYTSTGSRVSYAGRAYRNLSTDGTNLNFPPSSNPAKWKEIRYDLEPSLTYSIYVPSYKRIESINNNGAGTITITINNHGFTNGAVLPLYCDVYSANNFLFYIPYQSYTVSGVTTNTFNISFFNGNNGTFNQVYGEAYLTGPQVTGFTGIGTNTLTITAPDHGLPNGVNVNVYLQGVNDNNNLSTVLNDWYTVSNVTANTFQITTPNVVQGVWSGYGYVDIFNYRVSNFVADNIPDLNTRFNGTSEVYVGFLVKYNDCIINASNTCRASVYRNDPVRLIQLPVLSFTPIAPSYCPDDPLVSLTGNQTDGSFSSDAGAGGTNEGINDGGVGSNIGSFDPSDPQIVRGQTFDIIYQFLDQNGCTSEVTQTTQVEQSVAAPTAPDVQYCQGETAPILVGASGTGTDFIWYDDVALTNQVGTGSSFNTGLNSATPQTQTYYVVQTTAGCNSAPASPDVVIKPAPGASFVLPPPCVDRNFTLNGTPGMVAWDWNFGDGVTATGISPSHMYTTQGPKDISLTVTDADGCKGSIVQQLPVGPNPKPNFTFDQTCNGDNTAFHATSDIGTEYSWDFGDGNTSARGPAVDRFNTYAGLPNNYTVTLTAYTTTNCSDVIQRQVPILPYLTGIDADNAYIAANLGGGNGLWSVEDVNGNSTWDFEVATKTNIISTSPVWVTNPDMSTLSGKYKPNDKSYVNSPCMNITALVRPVFSMDYIADTRFSNIDGVTLEYSVDGGITWTALGNQNTGLDWFNTQGFSSTVGNNSLVGWSGELWTVNAGQNVWMEGKHKLDNITPKNKVRFRIAIGTNGDSEFEGFAFTDVKIESRNRLLLAEHFTNENDPAYNANKTIYDGIAPLETVKVQYHVNYPDQDLNSKVNIAEQTARSAYYGIVLTDPNIPRTYIDGVSNGDITGGWATTRRNRRELVPSIVDLAVASQPAHPSHPEYLKAEVTITALQAIPKVPAFKNVVVRMAVVEKTDANNNQFVFRKYLSSPVGKSLYASLPLAQGASLVIEDSVLVNDALLGGILNDISIIAYVQEDSTREVFQSAIELTPTNLPTPVTGVEDPEYAQKISLFPNPANAEVNIQLPTSVTRATAVTMVDSYGRLMYINTFSPGEDRKTVSTTELAGGVYILQIGTPDGKVARKKVMVLHR